MRWPILIAVLSTVVAFRPSTGTEPGLPDGRSRSVTADSEGTTVEAGAETETETGQKTPLSEADATVATDEETDLGEQFDRLAIPDFEMKTLGGRQFWGDVAFFRGWKIQQNVITKHYRLLDARDNRHTFGSLEKCREKLASIRDEQELQPMSGHAVILLHGIFRSSKAMVRLRERLESDECIVVPFDYPSTRVDLAQCSNYLGQVIDSLEGVESISFVCHSMGGLVVRSWLRNHQDQRLHRMVMLGTPNSGSQVADTLRDWRLYRLILGPAGQQLVSDAKGGMPQLPTPGFPFAVIAGSRGTDKGFNPVIPGDDDGLVSVASAGLPGAADFMTVPVMHSFLPFDERSVIPAVRFIQTGALRETGECVPLPRLDNLATEPATRPATK